MNTWPLVPEFWSWMGESALQIAGLSVVVLVVELLAWRSLSARARFALWGLVLLRAFLPPLPDPYNRVPRLIDLSRGESAAVVSAPRIVDDPTPTLPTATVPRVSVERPVKPTSPRTRDAEREPIVALAPAPGLVAQSEAISFESVVASVWAAGFVLSLGWLLWREARFRGRLRRAQRVTDPNQLAEIETSARAMGMLRPIEVYALDLASGPASAGILRAQLLLPSDFFTAGSLSSRRCVLLHELAHLRRFDGAGNLVVALAQALQWFNPFLHLAARRFRAVREQVRDCEALSVANPPSPAHYAATLLDALEQLSGDPTRGTTPAIGLLEGQEWKRRILMIRSYGRSSRRSAIVSTLLVGGFASFVLVGASAKPILPLSEHGESQSNIRVEKYAKPQAWLIELERGLSKKIDRLDAEGSGLELSKAIADLGGIRVSCAEDVQQNFEGRVIGLTLRDVTVREALDVLAQMIGEIECVETPSGMVFTYPGNVPGVVESRFYSLDPLLVDVPEELRGERKSEIVELVRSLCGDYGCWDRYGYGISTFRDLLIVKADPRAHNLTLSFLEQLSARRERSQSSAEPAWTRALEESLSKRMRVELRHCSVNDIAEQIRKQTQVTLIVPNGTETCDVEIAEDEYSVREICAILAPSIGSHPTPWNGAIRFAPAPRTEIGMYDISALVESADADAIATHREELFDMVRSQVQPHTWDIGLPNAMVGYRNLMIVRHTPEALNEIRDMLDALSRAMAGG